MKRNVGLGMVSKISYQVCFDIFCSFGDIRKKLSTFDLFPVVSRTWGEIGKTCL